MKKSNIIHYFISGTIDEAITVAKLNLPTQYKSNSLLSYKPHGDHKTLAFYSLKHARFDILEHFKYDKFTDKEIYQLCNHLGGKCNRFKEWIEKFNDSNYQRLVNTDFEVNIIIGAIKRSTNL